MKDQRILPYVVEVMPKPEGVTAWAGLPSVLDTMRALALEEVIGREIKVRKRRRGYSDARKVESLVLLMAAGGECVDDIEMLRADAGLCRLVGQLPSADRLLTFLYAFHDERLIEAARAQLTGDRVAYIPEENEALQGLARVNLALVQRVAGQGKCTRATLDHDATIQESHKREAQPHYKGGRGYQPSAIYWAEQDLVVADEYRDGNVPAGMENLRLIRRGFASLPQWVTERYFRADSACYDEEVLKWLADPEREGGPAGEIGFTISADMTPPLRQLCEGVAEGQWQLVEERVHETVWCTEVEFTPGNWPKDAKPLRYIAVRFRARQGQLFGTGSDVKYLAVVSNRTGEPMGLLRWHWQKAGTIEPLHDVTKNELAARVPPCGRFGADAAWYRLSMLTYNVLSAMKSLALPATMCDARPKRLRFSLFNIAGRIVSRGGKLILRIAAEIEQIVRLKEARARLAAVAAFVT
ncbi:MAG: transposase family protein [candidate division NC10 bacterium]|nr:transposase family protein [candidate division NC10 bacterium]